MAHQETEIVRDFMVNETVHLRAIETDQGRFFLPDGEATTVDYVDDRDPLLVEASRNLETARSFSMPATDTGTSYNSRWNSWRETIFTQSKKLKTPLEALHYAQSSVPFDHREKWNADSSEKLLALINNEFPWFIENILKIPENKNSISTTCGTLYDVTRSNILFWHLRHLCFCKSYASSAKTVLEIGGGYGGLARLWAIDNKVKKYIIVDIPESLFFAEVALKEEFGDRVGYWNGCDPDTQFVLLPVNRILEYNKPVDLIINTGSMQEMSDQWINFYMTWLDQIGSKYFYSLNYMGQPIDGMFESRTFWAPRPSNLWDATVINSDPPLIKLMSIGRYFCDVLYERRRPTKRFEDWSVFRGDVITRQKYLEGLELLRLHFNVQNATRFIESILHQDGVIQIRIPKEVLYICHFLKEKGVKTFDDLYKRMVEVPMLMTF